MVRSRRTPHENQGKSGSHRSRYSDKDPITEEEDVNAPTYFPFFTTLLVSIQVMVFFCSYLSEENEESIWTYKNGGTQPDFVQCKVNPGRMPFVPTLKHELWRYVSYQFVNDGLRMILINCCTIFLFGGQLEWHLGILPVAVIYAAGLIAAPLFHCSTNGTTSLMGASAAGAALKGSYMALTVFKRRYSSVVIGVSAWLFHLATAIVMNDMRNLRNCILLIAIPYLSVRRCVCPSFPIVCNFVQIASIAFSVFTVWMDIQFGIIRPVADSTTSFTSHNIGSLVGLVVGMVAILPKHSWWRKKIIIAIIVTFAGMAIMTAVNEPAEDPRVQMILQLCEMQKGRQHLTSLPDDQSVLRDTGDS